MARSWQFRARSKRARWKSWRTGRPGRRLIMQRLGLSIQVEWRIAEVEVEGNGHAVVRDRALLQAYLHVVLMVLVGSTTAPAAKYIVHSLPLTLIPVLRFALAAVCLVPLVVVWRGLGPIDSPGRLAVAGCGRLVRADQSRVLPRRDQAGADVSRRRCSTRPARWWSCCWRGACGWSGPILRG